MSFRVTWNGKEVRHPIKRVLVACVVIPMALLGALFGILAAFVAIVLGVVFYPVFKLFGRKGIIRRSGNTIKIKLDSVAFERK